MNKLKLILVLLLLALLLIVSNSLIAQENLIINAPQQEYTKAIELMQKKKFAAARFFFLNVLNNKQFQNSDIEENATYYSALCGLETSSQNADREMILFIDKFPQSNKVNRAFFELGRFYFLNQKYKKCLPWFNKVDDFQLNKEEITELKFKSGYAQYMFENYKLAADKFYEIKDIQNKYAVAATYYYAHINYQNKNYTSALKDFNKLIKDETFGAIVPYYILQIHFLTDNFKEVIVQGPSLIDSINVKRAFEINRIIAESYYRLKNYESAIPYFEKVLKENPRQRNELYQLAFSLQQSAKFLESIDKYKQVSLSEDSLSQLALYQMSFAYLSLNEKNFARNSFKLASKYAFRPDIAEDALFQYAKLCYELSDSPYDEAINAFREYLAAYPEVNRSAEVQKLLLGIFLSTKNYDGVMRAIDEIKNPNRSFQEAYQLAAFNKSIELFNNNSYDVAISTFQKVSRYNFNQQLSTSAIYWMAEAELRLRRTEKSINQYLAYLKAPVAASQPEFVFAHYNLAYAYFKNNDYQNASVWFRKFIDLNQGNQDEKQQDAIVRTADCFYLSKDFQRAAEFYQRGAAFKTELSDYANFQAGICFGMIDNQQRKLEVLNAIANKNESNMLDKIQFEIGKTHLALGNQNTAATWFEKVYKSQPNSLFAPRAMVQHGVTLYNLDRDDEALEVYKNVLQKYPQSVQGQAALNGIKAILIDQGKANEYADIIKQYNVKEVSSSALDTIVFEGAQKAFLTGNCEAALKQLNVYFDQFPNGAFLLRSHVYRSECAFKAGDTTLALSSYEYLAKAPKGDYTEKALFRAAKINSARKNVAVADEYFLQLDQVTNNPNYQSEAWFNLMRYRYRNNQLKEAMPYAEKLLARTDLNATILNESRMVLSKFHLENNDNKALIYLNELAKNNSKLGAEAKYLKAFCLHNAKDYKKCEEEIFEMADKFSSYDYWLAKAFILLADNYLALGDAFQAKATLQSIIDNYQEGEIKQEAQDKLNKIIATEKVLIESSPEENPQEPVEISL